MRFLFSREIPGRNWRAISLSRTRVRVLRVPLFVWLLTSAHSQMLEPQTPTIQDAASGFREEVMAEADPNAKFKDVRVFWDNHLAWVEESSGKRKLFLDGKQQGKVYDDIAGLLFSSDGAHFGFLGKRGPEWALVLDNQEHSETYAKVSPLSFQPHGSSYSYGGCQEKSCQLFIDGAASGAMYEDISYPQYSPDGKRLAFFGKRGQKWIAVVDGKELGPEADSFWGLAWGFTTDGHRFCAAEQFGKKWAYVIDGISEPAFDALSPIAFDRDDRHYAYIGASFSWKNAGTIVLDGEARQTYELGKPNEILTYVHGVRNFKPLGISAPEFNSEGKLVYSVLRHKGNEAVFVGDEAGPGFDEILSRVVFSRNSEHFAYVARRGNLFEEIHDNKPGLTAQQGTEVSTARRLFLGGGRRRPTNVGWIEMSPDGRHLSYEIISGFAQYLEGNTQRALRSVVMDGQVLQEYNALGIGDLMSNENTVHYLYEVRGASGDRDLINIDGHESRLYDAVAGGHFSADKKTVIFAAIDGRRVLRVTYQLPSE